MTLQSIKRLIPNACARAEREGLFLGNVGAKLSIRHAEFERITVLLARLLTPSVNNKHAFGAPPHGGYQNLGLR